MIHNKPKQSLANYLFWQMLDNTESMDAVSRDSDVWRTVVFVSYRRAYYVRQRYLAYHKVIGVKVQTKTDYICNGLVVEIYYRKIK